MRQPLIDTISSGITVVTGTDTDAGKTVTTAVLAAALTRRGRDVLAVKPCQTGLAPGEPGDVDQVGRLAGLGPDQLREYVRCPEPLAPTTSAARARMKVPAVAELAGRIVADAADHDVTLVEGAGGVLVGLDNEGATILDLLDALVGLGCRPHVVVATRSGLGTLNHTGLTCDALRRRGYRVDGIIIGSWPDEPDLAERCNLTEIADAAGAPLWACIPAGLGEDPHGVGRAAEDLCR